MSQFFIGRPIFAWVIAIMMMLSGAVSLFTMPVSQYPPIALPEISIDVYYPGASAKTIEDTVTQVIEQKMIGVDHLCYISASSDSSGYANIVLTFDAGTDPDVAQVQTQNKVQLAMPMLPQIVQQQGIKVTKSTRNFLMVIGFICEDDSMNRYDITDYVVANIQEQISRVQGVGEVMTFGAQYAMRIWLDPDKLNNYKLTPGDVRQAVKSYNVQVSAGQLGGTPAVKGQRLNATINVQNLLQTPEQFGQILLRTNSDGSVVRLKDVAKIEIGSESYDALGNFNGRPAAGIAVKMSAGANALSTVAGIKKRLDELSKFYPEGMTMVYPYDTTPFVRISIEEVLKTLVEAIVLVFLVMFIFLQNFRATIIPTIAVPVVLLGTFAVLKMCGYSINTLTMFAMVLTIGLLVDDAIVVIENVERLMSEEGLSPVEATRKSMKQITGALISIVMVLTAVFVPMSFFGGSTGVIYRQFSVTIITCMVLSVIVALIFTPALCATILKPVRKGHVASEEGFFLFRPFFKWFNRAFGSFRESYLSIVGRIISGSFKYIAIYVLIVAGTGYLFMKLPKAYLPDEDQGILFVQVMLPPGSTQEQTLKVISKVQKYFIEDEKDAVEACFAVAGFSFAGRGQNAGLAFVKLKDWKLRNKPNLRVKAVAGRAMGAFSSYKEALVFAFPPPAVVELGTANGFDLKLQDRGGIGHEKLMAARNQLLGMAAQNPNLMMVRPNGLDDTPEFKVDIDWERAGALGVSISDIQDSLSSALGSSYVNDFIDKGRVKKVFMQADAQFRMNPEDLNRWYVKNKAGTMVPFTSFAKTSWAYGSPRLERYNGFPSVEIMGQASPGKSSGDSMDEMEKLVSKLPQGTGFEWTSLSYQERMSGGQTHILYAISLIVVFLCLAALYESWLVPFAILLVVPLGVFGAILATYARGLSNDVYLQVGLLATVGLAAKNAILIVEFARDKMEHGATLLDATLEACRIRLRPILMTSFAFIFGVMPLAISTGAGSGAQNSIGTGVLGGMLSATVLAIFYIPLFYMLVMGMFKSEKNKSSLKS
ncbi:MAG TPA: hydrophobe/amphiphile efflux-1 family RND transporter [Lentisphaeria bacterium]|nr:MAG: multidrug efflux RND transporter permease [Lentisphaerae bacterium GWF2_49_21]HBC89619.1 hydrophobe/amphiphile efflux-1 family RND transporter [Lentisphaeria bacterium]